MIWLFLFFPLQNIFRYDIEVGPVSPLAVSLSAGVSGAFAAAVSHGFDTTRSRSQCTILPKVR